MKTNALAIIGVFTMLISGCGTQTLRSGMPDDGLYFDPKVEQTLNLAKAKERQANTAA